MRCPLVRKKLNKFMMVYCMTNEEFKYWIKGFLALASEETLDNSQFNIIINHANLVKAIVGELDPFNNQLITMLEDKAKQNCSIYLFDLNIIYETKLTL